MGIRTRRRFAIGCLAAATLGASACSGQQIDADGASESKSDSSSQIQSSFAVSTRLPLVAALGPELIAVDSNSLSTSTASEKSISMGQLGADDGWRPATAPDRSFGLVSLSTAGSSVVLAGASCDDEQCSTGSLEFYRREERSATWSQIGQSLRFESGLPALIAASGRNEATYIGTPIGDFIVTESGEIMKTPPYDTDAPEVSICVVGSTAIAVGMAPINAVEDPSTPNRFTATAVLTLDLLKPAMGWQARSLPAVELNTSSGICGPSGPLFAENGLETAYDASSDVWESQSSTLPKGTILQAGIMRSAISPDGSLFVLDGTGNIWHRTAAGKWESRDVTAEALVSTSDSTLSGTATASSMTFSQLPE